MSLLKPLEIWLRNNANFVSFQNDEGFETASGLCLRIIFEEGWQRSVVETANIK